jgi:hypothetical protein
MAAQTATTSTSPTKAALEAAVMDLTDDQIVHALIKVDAEVKRTAAEREADTWPREAARNILVTLARRLESGRVKPKG